MSVKTSGKYPTSIHEKVALAHAGQNPAAICRLDSCWVVVHEIQPLEGYCIILSDPVAPSLNDLPEEQRMLYCRDMARVGDAVMKVTGAYKINYETWGNLDPALHTHIVPRYRDEPDEKRVKPALTVYDFSKARKFDPVHDLPFVQKMRDALRPFVREGI
jgi:diadenosine tetraphosphate (Ap4A) HIT family hydrolase